MSNSLWDLLHEDLQTKIIQIRDYELEYDAKLLKVTNSVIKGYITDYMRKKGKRITNLDTAKKSQLLELFEKFKIPKIPYDIVFKDIKKEKKEINSKSKFETGIYTTTYENHFDGMVDNIPLRINIMKVTKCYVHVDITAYGLRANREFNGRLWINKFENYQTIEFSIYYIRSNELTPI